MDILVGILDSHFIVDCTPHFFCPDRSKITERQRMIGVNQSPPKRKVFRFHYHYQKVIGCVGCKAQSPLYPKQPGAIFLSDDSENFLLIE